MSFPALRFGNGAAAETSFGPMFAYSVGVHVLILFIVPLAVKLIWKPHTFERPATFQLVKLSKPEPLRQQKIAEKQVVQQKTKPREAAKPVPRNEKSTEKPKEEENVDELADLLNTMSQPAVDVSPMVSTFKYPWYINNIRSKVEENWKPPVENPDIYVEVTFTIFRDGTISEVRTTHSCGTPSLDNLAVRAIRVAAPFGKLPVGFSGDQLEVAYTLRPTRK